MFGLILACAFAATTQAVEAKKLKLAIAIRTRFIGYLPPHRPQGERNAPPGPSGASEERVGSRGGRLQETASLNPTQSHYDSFEYFLDDLPIFWISEVVLRSARCVAVRAFAAADLIRHHRANGSVFLYAFD